MKKVFVPKGETVTHNCLYTDRIVVKGVLRVSDRLVAREIVGGGVIEAREIVCDDICAASVSADFVTAKRIATDKLFVQFECRAQDIAVKDYAAAGYVNAGKLSLTLSDIQACDADKIITLKRKNGMLGLLWASWWRGLFLSLFYGGEMKEPQDEKRMEESPKAESSATVTAGESPVVPALPATQDDATIDLLIAILTDLRKHGYRVSKSEAQASDGEEEAA